MENFLPFSCEYTSKKEKSLLGSAGYFFEVVVFFFCSVSFVARYYITYFIKKDKKLYHWKRAKVKRNQAHDSKRIIA